mmetsp:Transcript_5486/g.6037  ORF Transcript_5486/g.6037 Transcript_5486/m.6037 type:complete len:98 (+) Transcript_5486:1303-1596(+)
MFVDPAKSNVDGVDPEGDGDSRLDSNPFGWNECECLFVVVLTLGDEKLKRGEDVVWVFDAIPDPDVKRLDPDTLFEPPTPPATLKLLTADVDAAGLK